MQESWLEKYHQSRNHKGTPRDEFEAFIHLSEDPDIDFNEDDAWNKVNARLGLSPARKQFHFSAVWKVAAAFLLIALSLVFYLKITDPSKQRITISAQEKPMVHELPDGSTVYLHANSALSYKEAFDDRVVHFEGLAYYEVTKSGTPFTIHMNELRLTVLGTAFSLEASDGYLRSYVEEGLVEVSHESSVQKVNPGELITFHRDQNKFILKENMDPNILSWKTGKFIFQNTPFKEAVEYLEKYYQVDFYNLNGYQNCTITAQFDKKQLQDVLTVLSEILDAEFQISESKVKTLGKGCI